MIEAARNQPPKAERSSKRSEEASHHLRCNALLLLVKEITHQLLPGPTIGYSIRAGESYPTPSLLILLAYCYCQGIYSSRDVEGACYEDPHVAGLFAGTPPDWKTLRRFRRVYRDLLQQCLLHILQRALEVRFGGFETAPADACVAQALDRWFEPICFPHPEREAGDRIERAVFVDGMLLD